MQRRQYITPATKGKQQHKTAWVQGVSGANAVGDPLCSRQPAVSCSRSCSPLLLCSCTSGTPHPLLAHQGSPSRYLLAPLHSTCPPLQIRYPLGTSGTTPGTSGPWTPPLPAPLSPCISRTPHILLWAVCMQICCCQAEFGVWHMYSWLHKLQLCTNNLQHWLHYMAH